MKFDEKACPHCAEVVKKAATKCKHCGSELPKAPPPKPASPGETFAGCAGLIVVALIIFFVFRSCTSESVEEKQAKVAQTAEDKRNGFHCLSPWDGSHNGVVDRVKAGLRDPESFEHDSTRITPVDKDGNHIVAMTYRARNGFGGMNVGNAIATVRQADCGVTSVVTDN